MSVDTKRARDMAEKRMLTGKTFGLIRELADEVDRYQGAHVRAQNEIGHLQEKLDMAMLEIARLKVKHEL